MEGIRVLEWLKVENAGSGSGYCYGDGSGLGDGFGSGFGSSFGNGDGDRDRENYYYGYSGRGYGAGAGAGSGVGVCRIDRFGYSGYCDGYSGDDVGCSGRGYGNDTGIKTFDSKLVYIIDKIATIIESIKGNLAKGYILNSDFTLSPCYVCKCDSYFAHGESVQKAREALQDKIFSNMDTDEAIEKFLFTFEKGKKYSAKTFYDWHHYLTGSCEMGRKSFMRDRSVSFDDAYTVDEFISMCENSFGSEIIKKLKKLWNN